MKYFIWQITNGIPHAQIWHDEPVTGEGKSKTVPLFQHKLTPIEELLPLDTLILKFKDRLPNETS